MRILAIDFGQKRIGLALSDPLGITAQRLPTLLNLGAKQVISSLKEICQNQEVGEVVMGLPKNMDGSIGPKAKEALEWVERLSKALGIPVIAWDERLTSRQVGRLMIEEGLSRKRQRENSDQLAATVILQSYLESKRH